MISKWETVSKKKADNFKIFDVSWIIRRHPEWDKESNFVVLDSADWVNIIPITKDNKIVFVEQYRHGIDDITLEIPGGLIEKGEMPGTAGERECSEETGYSSSLKAELLGKVRPNPAFLNNTCYSYVWFDCEKKGDQHLDGNEDIRVVEYSFAEVKEMILDGRIDHSLVLNAFFSFMMKFGKKYNF